MLDEESNIDEVRYLAVGSLAVLTVKRSVHVPEEEVVEEVEVVEEPLEEPEEDDEELEEEEVDDVVVDEPDEELLTQKGTSVLVSNVEVLKHTSKPSISQNGS